MVSKTEVRRGLKREMKLKFRERFLFYFFARKSRERFVFIGRWVQEEWAEWCANEKPLHF